MIPTGTLHDDGRTLVLRRTFTAGIEEVWASVTESERLGRWFGTWTGDPASGSVMVTMNAEPESGSAERFDIQACEPPRLLSVSATNDYGHWQLTVELSTVGGSHHARPASGGGRPRDAARDRSRLGVVPRPARRRDRGAAAAHDRGLHRRLPPHGRGVRGDARVGRRRSSDGSRRSPRPRRHARRTRSTRLRPWDSPGTAQPGTGHRVRSAPGRWSPGGSAAIRTRRRAAAKPGELVDGVTRLFEDEWHIWTLATEPERVARW